MADKLKITTPKGELRYVVANGEGKLNYDGDAREYTASIILPKKKAKAFYAEICDYFNDNKSNGCDVDEPMNKVMRKTEEGDYMFSFKTMCEFENDEGEVRKTVIGLANKDNVAQKLPDDIGIGNGSVGRISGAMSYYKRKASEGVSLFLNDIQILKFVKYVPDNGFEADEEGEFESFGDPQFDEAEKPKKPKKDKKKKKKKVKKDDGE